MNLVPKTCVRLPRQAAGRAAPRGRLAGVTLIEVLVVVAIAAILAAVAVPSLQSTLQANRVDTAANQFVAMLSMARSEAVKQGGNVLVASVGASKDWGASGWAVCAVPANTTPTDCTGGTSIPVQQVTALVRPMTIKGTAGALSFDSTGRLLGGTVTGEVDFIVCADGNTAVAPLAQGITVLGSGRSRISNVDSANVPLKNDNVTEMTCSLQ